MPSAFDQALGDGLSLLQRLPRRRDTLPDARGELQRFRKQHAETHADLAVDVRPGAQSVDYDLLLQHPAGGTVGLCWRADDGVPWDVEFADHWASNRVVSVGEHGVTIQQALLYLHLAGRNDSDLLNALVEDEIVRQRIDDDPPDVSDEERQLVADDFRTANGLLSADATHRWLQEMGLSAERFAGLLGGIVRVRKFKERIAQGEIEPHFARNRQQYDIVRFCRVEVANRESALRLADGPDLSRRAGAALGAGDVTDLSIAVRSVFARDLPPELATAPRGAIVGPHGHSPALWIGEVLDRTPAALDQQTIAAIRDVIFKEWLSGERARATIRWHWM